MCLCVLVLCCSCVVHVFSDVRMLFVLGMFLWCSCGVGMLSLCVPMLFLSCPYATIVLFICCFGVDIVLLLCCSCVVLVLSLCCPCVGLVVP